MERYWCLRLLLLLFVPEILAYEDLIVRTRSGPIQGYVHVSRGGFNYYVFAGIPYAKPPTGDLRFMTPQPVEPWHGVRATKKPGPRCPQVNTYTSEPPQGNEDCLYLSVYTKKLNGKAPVVVHIHGGAWILGDGPGTLGPQFLMDADIVLVDVNYRLGILGFLSMEDSVLPGNLGLKDQVMALRWVQENIGQFGGDPAQVTLMGECTGADAVYHHMISPMSKGLFHRAIAESGSSFSVTGVMPVGLARQRSLRLAELAGCSTKATSSKDILDCLRGKDAIELASKLTNFNEWQIDPVLKFGAVFEPDSPDAFLTGPQADWSPPTVPLLTGITSGEGLLRTMYFTRRDFNFSILDGDGFDRLMPMSLMLKDTSTEAEEALRKIRQFYLPENEISMRDFQNLTDMYGDIWFSYGVLEGANFSKGDVYMYYFDYTGDVTKAQFFGDKSKAKGAFHTEEGLYLWQLQTVPPFKGRDYEISRDLVKLWTNFIITGRPTPNSGELGFNWPTYSSDGTYLAIRKEGYTLEKGLLDQRYSFLKSINFRNKLM